MPSITTNETSVLSTTVTVAPLVLLSVVDHYERIFNVNSSADNSSNKRVVGVILGDNSTKEIKVTNSFAIPFEEDEKNPNIWFLDHNFIESMMAMFKKINAKERLIGWYHSGPKLKISDLQINELFKKFTPNPLLLIVDVKSKDIIDIPTDSYLAIEEIKDDGSNSEKTFIHIPSVIRAEEAEEIGVEHLLRDIRDQACGNLTVRLTNNFKSLKSLGERLNNIIQYLEKILANELPINNTILAKLQEIFNYLPNMSNLAIPENSAMASKNHHLTAAFNVKTNDELMMVYVGSLIRSIISFHNLIENKSEDKKEPEQPEEDQKEKKDEKKSETQEKKEGDSKMS